MPSSSLAALTATTRNRTDLWNTPQEVVDKVVEYFGGPVELDPCSNSADNPNVPCLRCFTEEQDGLSFQWNANSFEQSLWLTFWISFVPSWHQIRACPKMIEGYLQGEWTKRRSSRFSNSHLPSCLVPSPLRAAPQGSGKIRNAFNKTWPRICSATNTCNLRAARSRPDNVIVICRVRMPIVFTNGQHVRRH